MCRKCRPSSIPLQWWRDKLWQNVMSSTTYSLVSWMELEEYSVYLKKKFPTKVMSWHFTYRAVLDRTLYNIKIINLSWPINIVTPFSEQRGHFCFSTSRENVCRGVDNIFSCLMTVTFSLTWCKIIFDNSVLQVSSCHLLCVWLCYSCCLLCCCWSSTQRREIGTLTVSSSISVCSLNNYSLK